MPFPSRRTKQRDIVDTAHGLWLLVWPPGGSTELSSSTPLAHYALRVAVVVVLCTYKLFYSNQRVSDINNRGETTAWMKWKQLTGVLCAKKVHIKLKDKVYKTVIKPTMTYGAECWAVRKKDENRLHVAERRMYTMDKG